MSSTTKRVYTEEEVQTIISRAISKQEAAQKVHADHGLTLEEIKRLASEVGVEEGYIAAAARSLSEKPPEPLKAGLWGAPMHYEQERYVDGVLSDNLIAAAVHEIRANFPNDRGQLEVLGNSFVWLPTHGSMQDLTIRGEVRDGKTRLLARQKFSNWITLMHMGQMFAGMFVFLGAVKPNLPLALGGLVMMFVLFFAARFGLTKISGRRVEKVDDLLGKLETIILEGQDDVEAGMPTSVRARISPSVRVDAARVDAARPASPMLAPQAEAPPAEAQTPDRETPQLDLDALPDPPPAAEPSRRRRDVYGRLD